MKESLLSFQFMVVCYTAVFSVVTQRSSWEERWGALRDDTKNVAD